VTSVGSTFLTSFDNVTQDTGVNPAGNTGDTSPPIFWLGDVNWNISAILLYSLNLAPQRLIIHQNMSFQDYKTKKLGGALPPHTLPFSALHPPNLELALTPLSLDTETLQYLALLTVLLGMCVQQVL